MKEDTKEDMKENPYRSLSWDDLARWAGKDILDRGKGYRNRVADLAIASSGQLMATVEGQNRYLTQVWLEDGGLQHRCTCPYWGPCKHAVAVVLVYLERIGSGRPVPEITPDELEGTLEAYGLVDLPDDEPDSRIDPDQVRAALEAMPVAGIIDWATELIADHPELRKSLPPGLRLVDLDNESPRKPEATAKQIARIRQQIRLTAQERTYHDDWDDRYDDDVPDYSSVEAQFGDLLDAGCNEALIELGGELFTLGNEQVGDSDDDGEIAIQLTDCLKLVFEAMRRVGGPAPERLIRYWNMLLEDHYGLLDGIPTPVDDAGMTRTDWLRVAGEFMGRLDPPPDRKKSGPASRYRDYRRSRILERAVEALVRAGDNGRAVELMVSELPNCGNHVGLVDHLLKSGDLELAEHWAREGFRQTAETDPHIAWGLARKLQEVAAKQKNEPQVAALEAEFFFLNPDADGYRKVRKECGKPGRWEQVRPFLLRYLESGDSVRSDADWPLPETGLAFAGPKYRRFPDWDSLISVALDEQRPDNAVNWYRQAPSGQVSNAMKLAGAVRKTHPDVTLEIWKDRVESLIDTVKPKAYREAMGPLEDVKTLMQETGRGEEYRAYVAALRERHRAKRRLMEELDFLDRKSRKILDG